MLATRYRLCSDFTCACDLATVEGARALLVTLSAPVGDAPASRCPNRPADVRAVQEALNHFPPAVGGPARPLAVDGVCGTLTRRAIGAFQRRWGIIGAERDGVIDVDGPTIARLREGPPAPAGRADDARLRAVRPRLVEVVASARAVLSIAQGRYKRVTDHGDLANLARIDGAVAKVERHFHAGRTRDPAARLARIDAVYQAMQATLGLAAAGVIADAAPVDGDGALAVAWDGGFHTAGHGIPAGGHGGHMATIRVLPAARALGPDPLAYALVHALAHHVGPTSAPIVDVAYAHVAPDAYAALGPAGALRNADSYAQFAFDAAGRPGFDPRHDRDESEADVEPARCDGRGGRRASTVETAITAARPVAA
jgi:hypothetical protein